MCQLYPFGLTYASLAAVLVWDSALAALGRIGNLDELHVHQWTTNPCNVEVLLAERFELGMRHVVLHDVVHGQHAALSLLMRKLSTDERSHLHIKLSQVHLPRRLRQYSAPPPQYQVHSLSPSSGRTRAVTVTDYYLAAAVLAAVQLDGCTEITLLGDAAWRLFCGAYNKHAPTIYQLETLRIVLAGFPLPAPPKLRRGVRRGLYLPALRTLVLRAAPELGVCLTVDARQMVQLVRRFQVGKAARLDVQTVCIIVHGELDRFPAHMTLNGEEQSVAIGARGHEPVEALALDELFSACM